MRENTNREKIRRLMGGLGRSVRSSGRVYFTGGVSAVLLGWREMTLDVDLKADPEPLGFFEALPALKNSVDINIELASPADFVPELPGWRERSLFIAKEGGIEFFHYDFYAQALSKIERWHERDRGDVKRMLSDGLVRGDSLVELFEAVKGKFIRYPAVNAEVLQVRVGQVSRGTFE